MIDEVLVTFTMIPPMLMMSHPSVCNSASNVSVSCYTLICRLLTSCLAWV